ncbi:polyhydroxybutyrate depolymerase [Micromonospora sp. WMMD882]|uniref:extracellular catalytic domain type 1 short-chain-length polyhydroxyalkanoate depolymerase n=1 Tax=Micromonospora sp. WMMD882 TaxID=3015151 RepID=UPI00248C00FB|nr:PHB depolymerase family esterase [Micromonospora sp. WMMD882]WBB77649.1 polyhydroxybutyrate depolymerase [Micromonospora sp. WMMD882]
MPLIPLSGETAVGQPGTARRRVPSRLLTLSVALVALTVAGCTTPGDQPPPDDARPSASTGASQADPGAPRPGADVPAGSSAHTLTVDGQERTYRLYRPASVDLTGPVPLVVMLHGAAGTGEQAEEAYGWPEQADRGGFVVAFPDGVKRAWRASDLCCGQPVRQDVDDVAFVEALVGELRDRMPVDPARTYVSGISNGGLLAYRLACDTDLFAAVGVVATTLAGECPSPKPVSVLHIQGMRDQTMPVRGGPGKRDNGGTGRNPVKIDGPPLTELIGMWRDVDDCATPEQNVDGPVTRSTTDCAQGRSVDLVTIADAGHQWPGGKPNSRVEQLLGLEPPSTALDATTEIWTFFHAHPRPAGA